MSETSAAADLDDVVVIGAGQAGFQVAASLRDNGLCRPHPPCRRRAGIALSAAALSKAYLTGASDRAALDLRPQSYFAKFAIDLTAGQRVKQIDRAQQRIRLGDETTLPYDHLVLATGARNRALALPGADLDGVLQLRSAADADALRRRLPDLKSIVIVGAGFIGLELAALACSMGIAVTILEATARPMSRALSLTMSRFFLDAHQASGVRFVFDAAVTRFNDHQGQVSSVETADGQIFPADLVLVGIGVIPNVELAAEAGLATENGIVVDHHLMTTDPAISAIGDCAAYPQAFAGAARGRIESVQNAVDHARCVAARLTGQPQPYRAVPWFWSDQGPLKLQIAGLPAPHDHHVVRGDIASGAFSVFCFRDGRLAGVESVNKAADHMIARRLLGSGAALSPQEAAEPAFDLKARASAGALAA